MGQTQGILGDLGRDKGLANYDRNNDLETLLKKIVNVNKDTLSSVTDIAYEVPLLGSTLGPSKCAKIPQVFSLIHPLITPVVGEVKCIIDEVLNALENIVDGLLNGIGLTSQFRSLRGDYLNTLCEAGNLNVLGLCLDANLTGLGLRSDENQ
jgi:phage-related protein